MSKKTHKFKTEVQQLLDLVIHSLYSKKEIFLRELISNASDAIDRRRFEALTDGEVMHDDEEGRIMLLIDKQARTLTLRDNGIGMNADELDRNIGTIASSGTRQFVENLKKAKDKADVEMIGQFGVGFYASFMVADKVTVRTRRAGPDGKGYEWVSTGGADYTIEETEKDAPGTDVIVHLREDMDEFMDEWRLRGIVRQYSDYIAYPIVMPVTRTTPSEKKDEAPVETTEEQTLNSMKAIWRRDRKDVPAEEYNAFYKHISRDFNDPLKVVPIAAEGAAEFRALLFIPGRLPFDMYMREHVKGLQLYVKNVFITDDCKALLPDYLRFVKGVVDSSDLPLNVSRELLQDDAIIKRIRKSLVSKTLGTLAEMKEKEFDAYQNFYGQFGRILKEGVHGDFENLEKLKDLLLFRSSKTDATRLVSLKEYIDRMPQDQKEVYTLSAESQEAAQASPLLEAFQQKGYEVLFYIDPIDEWIATSLTEFGGKKFKAIDRGDIDLETGEASEAKKKVIEEASGDYGAILKRIQERLEADIKEVRFSRRLTDSPCCLVSDEQGLNPGMERLMRAMNQEVPVTQRILELNPTHPLLPRMKALAGDDAASPLLDDYTDMLYGMALVMEGTPVKQPQHFAALVSRLMAGDGKG